MSFGFSVGDFIAAALLLRDIGVCLKDTGGSASEYREVMLELDGLRMALDKIEHLQVSRERQPAVDAIKVAALNCQYVLKDHLTKLQEYKALEQDSKGRIKTSARKIQWELAMKTDVQQLRYYLAAHTSSLNMRLVTEGLQAASISAELTRQRQHEVQQNFDDTKRAISHVDNNVAGLSERIEEGRLSSILDKLSVSNVQQRQQDLSSRRQEHTSEWLLEEQVFLDWLEGDAHNTIWCRGDPGTGKTIIASMVIQYLQHRFREDDIGIVFLYCDYKDQAQQTCAELVGSLIRQLVEQKYELRGQVSALFESNKLPDLQDCFSLLKSCCHDFSRTYVVVDALDECHVDVRSLFLPLLAELERASIKLLVTSRPNPEDIEIRFEKVSKITIRATDEDIRHYLLEKIAAKSIFRKRISTSQLTDIVNTITSRASGMFLMAVLQVERIWVERTPSKIMKALHDFPSKLEEVYDVTIKRIQGQPESDSSLALLVLQWITYAKRPLLVNELCQALAVEWNEDEELPKELDFENILDENSLVDVCFGLVVVEPESGVVRLVHNTTVEYFREKGRSLFTNPQYHIARSCLVFLAFENFKDQLWWEMGYSRDKYYYTEISSTPEEVFQLGGLARDHRVSAPKSWEETAHDLDARLRRFSYFRYAAQHWHEHFLQSSALRNDAALDGLALRLLRDKPMILMAPHAVKVDKPYTICECTTGLHVAAAYGLDNMVAALLKLDNDSPETPHSVCRMSPLHFAARSGQEEVTRLLLLHGAKDINTEDSSGWTPLHFAAYAGHDAVAHLLLEGGACSEPEPGSQKRSEKFEYYTPLHLAATCGRKKVVETLLQHGANIEAINTKGETPIHMASRQGHKDVVELLLGSATDIDPKTGDGWTPLHVAVERGHQDIVELLLGRGCDVEARDYFSETALHKAAEYGYTATAGLLIQHGADVNAGNFRHSRGALHRAARRGYNDIIEMLLRHGARHDATDRHGWTALHVAAVNGHDRAVQMLLRYGASSEAKVSGGGTFSYLSYSTQGIMNSRKELAAKCDAAMKVGGLTPLALAEIVGQQKVANILQAAGVTAGQKTDGLDGD